MSKTSKKSTTTAKLNGKKPSQTPDEDLLSTPRVYYCSNPKCGQEIKISIFKEENGFCSDLCRKEGGRDYHELNPPPALSTRREEELCNLIGWIMIYSGVFPLNMPYNVDLKHMAQTTANFETSVAFYDEFAVITLKDR